MKYFLSIVLSVGLTILCQAQTENHSALSIREIMRGEEYVGYLPENPWWSEDGESIYFSWNPDFDTLRSTYKIDVSSRKISKLTFEELKNLPSKGGDYNSDHSEKVYVKNGDIFLMDVKNGQIFQVTNTTERASNPQFSRDEKLIIYQSANNLFSWDIQNGAVAQLTNFVSGNEKIESIPDEMHQWLEQDQLAYFDILRKQKYKKDAQERRSEQQDPPRPPQVFLGKKQLVALVADPTLNHVVYMLMERAADDNTIVSDFVTQSGYTKDIQARSKVGSQQNSYETWIYNRLSDSTYQIKTDEISGIYDKPEFRREYEKSDSVWIEAYHDAREVIVMPPRFADDGKAVVVVRSQDNKDRWIMRLDLADGSLKLLDRQRDEAWVGGPGISGWNFSSGNIGWIDNENIWYQSEETGYSHLYKQNVSSKEKTALTSGKFEIRDAELSKDRKTFFVTSNLESPHQHHFYHLPVNGGKMKIITSQRGGHQVVISPDEKLLAVRYSESNKPWELYLMHNKPGAEMEQITHSPTEQFLAYEWRKPEIIRFEAGDGAKVPARIYKPENPNGAGIIFVHGAGYLQNVHEWWSSYYREYMFHNMLVDNGYTVLDIDYRASDGYGRDWRTGIYRFMGGKDLNDQLDGAKYLVEELDCDPKKLGIYGGSYGGFMTLMAMFTAPGTFRSGAALRSVTDWAHYNHGYTSNILNTPVKDSIAYAKSSPIYHAAGLEGNLLMLHGMVDTNVQFQDVVRLSQRLIELEKENWELAVFPTEGHGFQESSSWADEYRRIFELFQETLRDEE
jgi:dipeptidyl aminopeptidase/acylaminoacyl peptidase